MCTKTNYTLPCEHVRTIMTYCHSAPPAGTTPPTCQNLAITNIPNPPPPNVDPATIPSCPLLPDCPYEVRNRRWYCCWCGKENERGRCECVMVSEGNHYRCEHICCVNCEAAPV